VFEIYLKYRDKKDTAPEKVRRYVEIVDEAIKALSRASPKAARVFELKMKGISVSAISKVFGISLRQVSDYLTEANTFLKNYIAKSAGFQDTET
jgi:DNA-directed RNA polymerase specialized sigma24 family protein